MIRAVVFAAILSGAPAAFAQQAQTDGAISTQGGGSKSMKDLLSDGYEIKTSVPSGTKFIVFMQKDKSAYACEFVSLTRSRCGSIN
ncbi:hypothetical protein [Neorhizobium galegae]|uniref:hypothetical protein n=1 Tax=Neorhizobium galegae TaxID=399 RepID=UPI0006227524|nr:hypothetical protein [Neorhizobium galegae]CDZ42944.1 Hypothetical protein NGAL_HAMBI1146_57170 [Neorhizobium galegae bv. officinalis]KAA9386692.1 hypothetical protein F4V88_09520 [Neorhizobium galegae]KAB1109489.1 hypothetical protein F4V89_27520 [Neorhizobium galegae]MCM2501492.1 hypothetical protein [Neorhizobium galegae]MCQ1767724.1 hypothetical protein [Neorhizobium galegae]